MHRPRHGLLTRPKPKIDWLICLSASDPVFWTTFFHWLIFTVVTLYSTVLTWHYSHYPLVLRPCLHKSRCQNHLLIFCLSFLHMSWRRQSRGVQDPVSGLEFCWFQQIINKPHWIRITVFLKFPNQDQDFQISLFWDLTPTQS